jgi:hypothetical protein
MRITMPSPEIGDFWLPARRSLATAKNVGFALLDDLSDGTDVPTSHTCSSGRATSQLALMSGTLTPAGGFASREWESTDKPTASAVGG